MSCAAAVGAEEGAVTRGAYLRFSGGAPKGWPWTFRPRTRRLHCRSRPRAPPRVNVPLDSCALRSWRAGDFHRLVRYADNRKIWRNLYYVDAFYGFLVKVVQQGIAKACWFFERWVLIGAVINGTTQGARQWKDLPAQAIKYIKRVEELIECPVALVSTSPQRDDTILVTDPFAD